MSKAKINPDFTYKTRDGQEVTEVSFTDVKEDDPYVVCAKVDGCYEYFTEQGYYYKGRIHHLDLIKQPVKKTKPEVKQAQKEVVKNASTPEVVQQETITQHIHHDMIVAWAKNTDLKVQFKSKCGDGWITDESPSWDEGYEWRFKPEEPKLLTIIGVDGKARSYPEPCRVKPNYNREYFVPVITFLPSDTLSQLLVWIGGDFDEGHFSKSLVHSTKEAAELHAKAMLGID